MEEHLLFSIYAKLNFHSFKIHYIRGFFFLFKTLCAQSVLIFGEIIAQVSCPPGDPPLVP